MLPDADALPEILLDPAVPHEDINDLVALRRTLTADVRAMGLLEECVEGLVRVAGLPRRTSVEGAVGDHLRAGGHWYMGQGWLRL
ncbi:hypothetical protein SAMN06272771_1911 [Streptomyces sp. Ag82_O1-12]|uniref:acyltransferase domain-containing protein n=1 Tax=unclassified Streptomyces TaxID=2593676 RepID=UPI000BCB7F16|nr:MULTISPECIES: acyltransferase domain-containing protein [unclassified Streptomyces]SMQ15577.1 hypothetical protein SAMN06272771_1911 [Streptomyces sp. Ag82_O1-12]SOD44603.1 hypothetical protein SAMN06272727_1903 [Streptomyces sp. Ag82_G6-1]